MEHIVFLDRGSVGATVKRPSFPHTWEEHDKTLEDEVVSKLEGASIAITNKVSLRAETLAKLPALKLIAVAATGTDVVDVAYCREHGIAVANIRDYAVRTVPEHAFALILALRLLPDPSHSRSFRQHDWNRGRGPARAGHCNHRTGIRHERAVCRS